MEVMVVEIEEVIHYTEMILNRKLTEVEVLAVALAYHRGILEGSKTLLEIDSPDV